MTEQYKGFFASLFDLSFHRFVTPTIIQFVYLISLIGIAIWSFFVLVSYFVPSYGLFGSLGPSAGGILLHLILAPITFILGAISARISLEFIVAVFRIAENTESLRR